MNQRFDTPEIIGAVRKVDDNGNDIVIGDRVVGIQVIRTGYEQQTGLVQLDIRNFQGRTNLILEVELAEITAAISRATFHAEP